MGGMYKDLVSGNEVTFNIIDDLHFTLTYDSPNYALMTNRADRRGHFCGVCWFVADHYMSQFHPDYANAADPGEGDQGRGRRELEGTVQRQDQHAHQPGAPVYRSVAVGLVERLADSLRAKPLLLPGRPRRQPASLRGRLHEAQG